MPDRSEYLELGKKNNERLEKIINATNGDLENTVLASDAFFPFRDVVDLVADEGVKAIIMPGGAFNDFDVIQACNEHNIGLGVTGERGFAHF